MAGTSLGASTAPLSPVPFPAVLSTRTRRYHGVFVIGGQVMRVFSSRLEQDFEPVILTLGDGALTFTGRLAASGARQVAQALIDAAARAEQEGRRHG